VYLPSQFQETRVEVMHALMRSHPLAALITPGEAGIVANHLPIETVSSPEPYGLLRGHVARANSLWQLHRESDEALVIFQGPQAYISPTLYATKQRTGEVVPTWNYAVVHARGTLRFVQDATWLRALVSRLTDAHEAGRAAPWKIDDAPADYLTGMLAAIVGFELPITSLSGKWKVSQNRDSADQQGVVVGLRATQDPQSRLIADMLESRGDGVAR
jgi:transcriptional regulator